MSGLPGARTYRATSELTLPMASQTPRPCIVWFRDDLRLSDHPALHAASKTGAPVICLYVFDEQSRRTAAWRRGALVAGAIAARPAEKPRGDRLAAGAAPGIGGKDHRRSGARDRRRRGVLERDRASAASGRGRSGRRRARMRSASPCKPFPAICWWRPRHPQQGRPGLAGVHAVLEAGAEFWRSAEAAAGAEGAKSGTGHCRRRAGKLASRTHASGLGRRIARDLDAGRGVRAGAAQAFLERRRGRLFRSNATGRTARGPQDFRRICALARSARGRSGTPRALPPPSIQLGRRHRQIPQRTRLARILPASAVRRAGPRRTQPAARFRRLSLENRRQCARAWQRGRTGYPIVDAGMRELWHTGVMHNRVRMVVASFLVKHLLIDWREGENGSGTRWSMPIPAAIRPTGNGSRAPAPMPRPISGCSIRSCRARSSIPTALMSGAGCRNLRDLPASLIHQPWTATPLELAGADISLGKTYPEPIIDHKAGRERALAAYAKVRAG